METVDSVWSSKLGLEQGINLLEIRQVGFSGDDLLGSLGGFGLDDIGQDELDVGCLGVGQELRGELNVSIEADVRVGEDLRYLQAILQRQ